MTWPTDDIGRSAARASHRPNVVAWPGSPRRTYEPELLPQGLHCLSDRRCTVGTDCTSPATCRLLAYVEQPAPVNPVPMRLREPTLLQRLEAWMTQARFWRCYAAFVVTALAGVWVWRAFFASAGPL